MKKQVFFMTLVLSLLIFSCKKENPCEGCINGNNLPVTVTNHPPIANAGNDTTITFPDNTVNIDGSRSTDPDNNISSYQWTKIAGPSSSTITNVNAVQTQVTNLTEGSYQFELKVSDADGLIAKDTVKVILDNPNSSNTIYFNNLTWSSQYSDCRVVIPNFISMVPLGRNFEVWRSDTFNPRWTLIPYLSYPWTGTYYDIDISNGNFYYFENYPGIFDCSFDPTRFSFAIVVL